MRCGRRPLVDCGGGGEPQVADPPAGVLWHTEGYRDVDLGGPQGPSVGRRPRRISAADRRPE